MICAFLSQTLSLLGAAAVAYLYAWRCVGLSFKAFDVIMATTC
jgi:hypothetical protein